MLWLRRPGLDLVMNAVIAKGCMSEPFIKKDRSVATPSNSPRVFSLVNKCKDCCSNSRTVQGDKLSSFIFKDVSRPVLAMQRSDAPKTITVTLGMA